MLPCNFLWKYLVVRLHARWFALTHGVVVHLYSFVHFQYYPPGTFAFTVAGQMLGGRVAAHTSSGTSNGPLTSSGYVSWLASRGVADWSCFWVCSHVRDFYMVSPFSTNSTRLVISNGTAVLSLTIHSRPACLWSEPIGCHHPTLSFVLRQSERFPTALGRGAGRKTG